MKFKRIEIQNFMAIKHAEIDLDKQGLVLIKGDNEDNPSFLSNGAGKSSIIESIVYVLFGRTIRGVRADDIVNKTVGCNCKVTLDLVDDDGSTYKITRYRKHKTHKNSISYYHNTTDITPKSEMELNKAIVSLLQTDYLTFTSSILYSAESFKFTQASDAEMKQAFEIMLDLGIYSKCQDEVKLEISDVNAEINKLNLQTVSLDSKIQVLIETQTDIKSKSESWKHDMEESIKGYQSNIDEFKNELHEYEETLDLCSENISYADESILDLQKKLDGIVKSLSNYKELREHLEELRDSESQVSKALRDTKRKIDDYSGDIESLKRKISRLEKSKQEYESKIRDNKETIGTPCPVCGRPLSEEHIKDALDELQNLIKDTDDSIEENGVKIESVNKKIKKLKDKSEGYEDLLQEVRDAIEETESSLESSEELESRKGDLSNKIKDLEHSKLSEERRKSSAQSKIDSIQEKIKFYHEKIADFKNQDNPYENQLDSYQKKIAQLQDSKLELSSSIDSYQSSLDVLQFWLKGFSNSGIKSMLLDDITPFLNERANKYLQVLSGNHVRIEFSTQTTLKSGEIRDKFQIQVINDDGGNSYMSNSSGEKRRIDVAINLALQDLIASRANKKLNIMFMDEVLDTLDRQGTDSVIELLMEISKEKSSVFVISHNEDIQSYFQNFLLVTKKDGCSVVEKVVS